jgi:membrane protein YqaA with SNARE-associated domain
VAAAVGLAMRRVRSGAVKAGGDLRGTALVEDGAGVAAAALAVVPFVGYLLTVAAGWLFARLRRREDRKYSGLRVLR